MMDFESKKFILQVDLLDKIYNHSKFVRFVISRTKSYGLTEPQ